MVVNLQDFSSELANLVQSSSNQVLRIEGRNRYPASGIVWGNDGVVVTAHHVLERDEGIKAAFLENESLTAKLIGRDPTTDIAVLMLEGVSFEPVSRLPSSEMKTGHFVLALGKPGGSVRASLGMVNTAGGSWRTAAGGSIERYIQTSVDMLPGFSGGPLISMDGRLAGMNTSALGRDGSLVIPIETLDRVVTSLRTHGRIRRAYLGITSQPVRLGEEAAREHNQATGLMIIGVEAGGPAAAAGVLQGDILLAIGSLATRRIEDLMSALTVNDPTVNLDLKVLRGGKVINVVVHPTERE